MSVPAVNLPLPLIDGMRVLVFDTVWAKDFHEGVSHELLHVLSGHLVLTFCDGRMYPAGAGDTLLLPAHTVHRDQFDAREELKVLLVHFRWDVPPEYLTEFDNGRLSRLSDDVRLQLRWIFEHMRDDLTEAWTSPKYHTSEIRMAFGDSAFAHDLEAARLLTALTLMRAELHRQTEQLDETAVSVTAQRRLVARAKGYLERNYSGRLSLDEVAAFLAISPYYLSRLFRRECGFSFYEYLTEIRIEAAKRLLRDTRDQISEVACKTGYDNGNYFAKAFRRKTGLTPGEFRKEQ